SSTYSTSYGNGGTATSTVHIVVQPVNDTPVARDDADSLAEDSAVTTDVLANDSGLGDRPLRVVVSVPPQHGTTSVGNDLRVTYTPAHDYNGMDRYSYQVTDVDGDNATAVVRLSVSPVNDAPVAVADAASTDTGA